MSATLKGIGLGIVAVLLLAVATWLVVVYTGLYNVAASDWHADPVRWTLETTMRRSVAVRADEIQLPETFSEELIAQGAVHYSETCAHCHGAPGRDPSEWSRGMRPEPPLLTEAAPEWSAEEIYWIVKHGIKMTGMPAFGADHKPQELKAITAFVAQLPEITPEQYTAMTSGGDHGGESGHSH